MDRYLFCQYITGEWFYKDMKTGEDLPIGATPIDKNEKLEDLVEKAGENK